MTNSHKNIFEQDISDWKTDSFCEDQDGWRVRKSDQKGRKDNKVEKDVGEKSETEEDGGGRDVRKVESPKKIVETRFEEKIFGRGRAGRCLQKRSQPHSG